MPFYFALAQANGTRDTATDTQFIIGPTIVDYPADPLPVLQPTLNGTIVLQQPAVDNRPRTWQWQSYPDWYPQYGTLWGQIEGLRSRYRLMASGSNSPYVWLRDTESKQLRTIAVAGTVVTSTYPWLQVRVLSTNRHMRTSGSSLLVWEQTNLVFTVTDVSYNDLG